MKFFSLLKGVKAIFPVIFLLLMSGFGVHFLIKEGVRLNQIWYMLLQSNIGWLWLGIGLSWLYVWLHAEMYRQSFKAFGLEVSLRTMMRLYLKRNLMSVLLPAGFIASQTFFSSEVARSENIKEPDVWGASGIFSIALLISNLITVLPTLGWLLTENIIPNGAAEVFAVISVLLFVLIWIILGFIRRGMAYRWCRRYFPTLTQRFDNLEWSQFQTRYLLNAIVISCVVMILGVIHILVSAHTLGVKCTLTMAFAGYVVILIVIITAPFLRGIGAVEAVLSILFMHFGLSTLEAVSVALLFRFFEFWLVLLFAIPVLLFPFIVLPKSLTQQ